MSFIDQAVSPQLVLSGEIDVAVAEALRAAGARAAVDALGVGTRLEIDMAEVTFIDSSELGALVSIRKAADASGRAVALLNVAPSIIRLFELTGLRDSFTVLPTS